MFPWDEGYAAALNGEYDCENPYVVLVDEDEYLMSEQWLDGWANGRAAYQSQCDY
jgi:ribosome modulation factor